MNDEQRDALLAAINSTVSESVEYEESHIDAGNAYTHMPYESWSNSDDKNLADFMRDNEIDACGLETETLAYLALDNFTMRSEHVLHNSLGNYFCCGSCHIGEVETQLDFATLSELAGFTVTRAHVEQLGNDPDCYIGKISSDSCLAYSTSDVVWLAEISADKLREVISDKSERS